MSLANRNPDRLLLATVVWLALMPSGAAVFGQTAVPGAEGEGLGKHQGITVGFTQEGHPFLGDPQAPVILEDYSDYLCPFCGRYFNQTLPALLDAYVRTGKIKYVFRDFPLASLHPTAPEGSAAALCVGEQGAALFWKMHDELFRAQGEWNRLADPGEFLGGAAKRMGADMAAYEECLSSGRMQAKLQESIAAGQALGFNGTPSFRFISAQKGDSYTLVGALPLASFSRLADPLIAGEKPPEEPKPPPPELPFWAKPEGLAPDPARPGYTVAGDPYKGNHTARLVVVEFTDFQCPSCRGQALETQPEIDKRFVETGKVMWVAKHLPLKVHPHAPVAAVAAECAGEQGMFWEMRQALFEKVEEWSSGDVDGELIKLAGQLQLDMSRFATCFNGRKGLERVLQDLFDAQGVVQRTPTFILIRNGKGAVLRGTRSAETFVPILEKMLEEG